MGKKFDEDNKDDVSDDDGEDDDEDDDVPPVYRGRKSLHKVGMVAAAADLTLINSFWFNETFPILSFKWRSDLYMRLPNLVEALIQTLVGFWGDETFFYISNTFQCNREIAYYGDI